MNRETFKEHVLPYLEAFAVGKPVQYRDKTGDKGWKDLTQLKAVYLSPVFEFRFKPMELHEYQLHAVEHIIENPSAGLFLEMGLGKTVSTSDVYTDQYLKPKG